MKETQRMQGIGCAAALLVLALGMVMSALPFPATPTVKAQEATPAAISFPVTPDPADCVVAPRALEEIVAIAATPGLTGSVGMATPYVPPTGESADDATTRVVTDTLLQVFACANAGDPLRFANFYTDRFLAFFFGGLPTEDVAGFLALPPQMLPQEQQRIIREIGDVQMLPDGRAGVVVVLDEPDDPRTEEPDFVILRQIDGRWLIDEVHEDALIDG
jgi:hypothetical protein